MKNKTPDRVWKLLSRRGSWTQDDYARDRFNAAVAVDDPTAIKFCSLGAIRKVYGKENGNLSVYPRLRRLQDSLPVLIYAWNDARGRTRKEVVALFKRFGV